MKIVLISTYELGHQPFGLASPAAWLRREGHEITCIDTSQQALRDHESTIVAADAVAFYLPMHTATRIGLQAVTRVRGLNPTARLCAYGLYAPMNAEKLAELGVERIIGGEFEKELVEWIAPATSPHVTDSDTPSVNLTISLDRLSFIIPDRKTLPPLRKYARLQLPNGESRIAGYTEATRGCKHLCRHCPIIPVYNGTFRVVQKEVVLADIRQQVEAGAQHITFGDPDFFNGPAHSLAIIEELHREFPGLSYDTTVKVEHLLKHSDLLPTLRDTGCGFVVSAIESFDDHVLHQLDKRHTRADFFRLLELFREVGLNLSPTFVAFSPWTTLASYEDFLNTLEATGLIENIPSIQLAIRLLIPQSSRLLELSEIRGLVGPYDAQRLCYPWKSFDPRADELQQEIESAIQRGTKSGASRGALFAEVRQLTSAKTGTAFMESPLLPDRATIPYLTEPWYC